MEKLNLIIKTAEKALSTLQEITSTSYSRIVRDAAIKRFEYTFEVIWKLTKTYLEKNEGIIANSPKSCFKEAFKVSLIDEKESILALEMTDDRNMTSHIYHEELAEDIYKKIKQYFVLMNRIFNTIKSKVI
jgi:nucleotidyltransferase substrate binding protein (TIGR01987 family)